MGESIKSANSDASTARSLAIERTNAGPKEPGRTKMMKEKERPRAVKGEEEAKVRAKRAQEVVATIAVATTLPATAPRG